MEQQVDVNSDEQLMSQYCEGSSQAFEILYGRHKGGLFRYFLRHCSSRDIAEELFQDVWIKIVNARQSYEQSAKFTTFLYRVAHNRLIDYYRHLGSAQYAMRTDGDNQEMVENADGSESTTRLLENEEQSRALKEAINNLPNEQREALLMQQEGHLSLAEIADIVGTSRETIKSRLRYAMQKLREQLGDTTNE
ncbi:MAG: RNA polymerase sigma factor [Gammaproteobacteria bacterium]|nr:RNA polymerase sigma factor [Gammaproteobacteria bacterium]